MIGSRLEMRSSRASEFGVGNAEGITIFSRRKMDGLSRVQCEEFVESEEV